MSTNSHLLCYLIPMTLLHTSTVFSLIYLDCVLYLIVTKSIFSNKNEHLKKTDDNLHLSFPITAISP